MWFNVAAYDPIHITGDLMVTYQYCGGTTQLNNATSLASADYAYTSQFVSNQFTYLLTQTGDIKKKFKAAKYEAELPHSVLLNCLHGFQLQVDTEVCDDENCETKTEDCPSIEAIELQLDGIVTNQWLTGQVWGEVTANMFAATIDDK